MQKFLHEPIRMIRKPQQKLLAIVRERPGHNPLKLALTICRQAMHMPTEPSRRRWGKKEIKDRLAEIITGILTVDDIPAFSREKKGALLEIVNQLAEHWVDRDPQGDSETGESEAVN